MLLQEINTPFMTKRCITYNKDQTKALYHHRNIQLVKGNIYRGETQPDPYKGRCDIYAFYDGTPVALWLGNVPLDYTVDEVLENLQRKHCLTLKNYLADVREKIQAPNHFMLIELEFIKHVAPELEESMRNARQAFSVLQKRKAEARRQQKNAEDEAYVSARNESAQKIVDDALEIIRNGGDLRNKAITFFTSRYSHKNTCVINHLMDQYGIEVPIRTRGWIKDRLTVAYINNGHCGTVTYLRAKGGRCSEKFFVCMNSLIQAVNQNAA